MRSTVELGRTLGLSVVAEGVEDADAWRVLAELACDQLQGYYLCRPLPEDAVLDWVRGTALRPVLSVLDAQEQAGFLEEYGAALREAYPRREFGTVLEYRRVFVVARRGD